MSAWEIVILVGVCVAFVCVSALLIRNKIKHKGGCCDCGKSSACEGCPHCAQTGKSRSPADKQ